MAKRPIKTKVKAPLGKDAGGDPHNHLPVGTLDGLGAFVAGCGLDAGIEHYVAILKSQGVETCQSCQGGPGHAYLEPTVDFLGGREEGPRAVAAALSYGLPVAELRRKWDVHNGEMEGPIWSMTFKVTADRFLRESAAKSAAWLRSKKTGRVPG
jgi:hypothetical protein